MPELSTRRAADALAEGCTEPLMTITSDIVMDITANASADQSAAVTTAAATASATSGHTIALAMTIPEFDIELIKRLNQLGPRYTSYPTADRFSTDFGLTDYQRAIDAVGALPLLNSAKPGNPLSLYIHIPFCASICYYCACNKVITKDRSKAAIYLDYLKREITMQAALFSRQNYVEQLHFGGGTPTYLSDEQMSELLTALRHQFQFAADDVGEYSIEVDPRTVSPQRIAILREQGFNRISLGIQDFDVDVQKAVNRIQPEADTLAVMQAARDCGFRSISVDLIYGLPKQTLTTIEQTLDKVILANPDRIAIYNYAHLPHLFKPQRRIEGDELPDPETKLQMLFLCISKLSQAGYAYIGMDHFAKPTDDLCLAQKEGRLQRNFQGYSTHAQAEMVSCGVSAISAVGSIYYQNEKTLDAYYARLDRGELPMARGFSLNADDVLRRQVIEQLMCHFELDFASLSATHLIDFQAYFSRELASLGDFIDNGLLTVTAGSLKVSLKGRLLIRNICMVFDKYLAKKQQQFSRVI